MSLRRTKCYKDEDDFNPKQLRVEKKPELPDSYWKNVSLVTKTLYVISFLLGCSVVCLWPLTYQFVKNTNDANLITLRTEYTPLDPKAFNSFIDREESRSSLHGILSWTTAAVSWSWMHSKSFAALIPQKGMKTKPGHVWRLVPDTHQHFMLSYKYVPPPPSGTVEELLFSLLSLFHPQPFLVSRYGPRGAVAVLRAKTYDTLDIIFRLHAEYQLNIPPRRPLWFTPATFMGRLIINTTDYAVYHFVLDVPTDQQLNIDLEWFIGPNEDEDMEVTITHLEKMQVFAEGMLDPNNFTWSEEITYEKGLELLQKRLYRYQKVKYHNFTKAFSVGEKENHPIHTLVLWGVLEDQSC